LILFFRSHYGPGVDSASNRNEYQAYFLRGKPGRCVGLKTLPPSCADCLEIWEPQPLGTLRACPGRNILILLASCQQTCMAYNIAVCTVKNSWWWTEELSETCRFSFRE